MEAHFLDNVLDKFILNLENAFFREASIFDDEYPNIESLNASRLTRVLLNIVLYLFNRKKQNTLIFILGPDVGELTRSFFYSVIYNHRENSFLELGTLPVSINIMEYLKMLILHSAFFNSINFSVFSFVRKSLYFRYVFKISYRYR